MIKTNGIFTSRFHIKTLMDYVHTHTRVGINTRGSTKYNDINLNSITRVWCFRMLCSMSDAQSLEM